MNFKTMSLFLAGLALGGCNSPGDEPQPAANAAVPAGTVAENSGHHHLLIDTALPDLTVPIPADANHLHFGDGSRSTELNLPSGEHTLQLLFADYLHIPHDAPVYSNRITIKVDRTA